MSGLLVRKGFSCHLLAPDDLPKFTELSVGSLIQRLAVPFPPPFSVLTQQLQCMFESVVERKGPGSECVSEGASEGERERGTCCVVEVHERVIVAKEAADRVVLQWVSDPVSDMVADAILAADAMGRGWKKEHPAR